MGALVLMLAYAAVALLSAAGVCVLAGAMRWAQGLAGAALVIVTGVLVFMVSR